MWGEVCNAYSLNAEKEIEYKIYADGEIVECADIDDMTTHANALLCNGYKDIRLVITD